MQNALIIQKYWKVCISNPEYKICQNIMKKEFYELKQEYENEQICQACYLGVCEIH